PWNGVCRKAVFQSPCGRSPSTHPVEPDLFVNLTAFGPVLLHLDVEEEVDGDAEHLRQLLARRFADGLDARPPLAEDDGLLAFTADDDLLVDLDAAVLALLIALRPHGAVVGQFLVELAVELLARDLGGEEAFA